MNRREREKFLYMAFLLDRLGDYLAESMEHNNPDAGRLRMAYNAVNSFVRDRTEHMSLDEQQKIRQDMARKEVFIDYKRAGTWRMNQEQGVIPVEVDDLAALSGYAMEFACQFCQRTGAEQTLCPLREALVSANAITGLDMDAKECPYIGLCAHEYTSVADRKLAEHWRECNG